MAELAANPPTPQTTGTLGASLKDKDNEHINNTT